MGTTANFGLRYPESSDDVKVWEDVQALAEDVDTDLLTLQGLITGIKAWTTFTPTLWNNAVSGTPASIAKTVTRAGYWRLGAGAGSIIIAQAEVTASAAVTNGAALSLPVNASERWLIAGVAAINGASPPTGQSGHAYMHVSLDRCLFVTNTNSFLNASSGDSLRYLMIYKAAS